MSAVPYRAPRSSKGAASERLLLPRMGHVAHGVAMVLAVASIFWGTVGIVSWSAVALSVTVATVVSTIGGRLFVPLLSPSLRFVVDATGPHLVVERHDRLGAGRQELVRMPLDAELRFDVLEGRDQGGDVFHRLVLARGAQVLREVHRFQDTPWDTHAMGRAAAVIARVTAAMRRAMALDP